jgi:uncharacterized protein (DUF952 family)
MDPLFHIITRTAWTNAVAAGEYRPPSLASEGFVHFSFADQVSATANLIYRDVEDLIVVEFDPAKLGADVVVEDSSGGPPASEDGGTPADEGVAGGGIAGGGRSGTEFPHVYDAIPVNAAARVHPLPRDDNGDYVFSPDSAADAASPDH